MRAVQITERLQPQVGGVYALGDAARAREALRDRSSTGVLVLDPTA